MNDVLAALAGQGAVIERLCSDSRRAGPGAAFFAYPGEAADGRAYISDALARGAAAVVWEQENFRWQPEWRAPNAPVRNLKQQAGPLAAAFYGHPSESLWVCGVTGTNGKTSCSHWIAAALAKDGVRGAVIGTLGSGTPGALQSAGNTTPDALDLQALLKRFVEDKQEVVAMEVSSHGLVQGRVNGIAFDCALFTNLTQDHLDYHGSMEAYGEAKAQLFDAPGLATAVINLDDAFGRALAQRLAGRLRVIGYGLGDKAPARTDDYLAASLLAGIDTGQVGSFNTHNVLGVTGCLLAYGMTIEEIRGVLRHLPSVPGRMQKIGERPLVVVDYAHTPDALEKVLAELRPAAQERGGKLAVVFGAGGDRDPAKRTLMGEAAARLADRVILTSDNPRSEDPLQIIAQVKKGAARGETEADRARAIERAILEAAAEDVVLIAGKGHEDYQEIAGRRLPFSDAAQARAALARRGAA
ncbi:MAG: UDP-N-acetylmuramoyl-L-alanyl-D-glutamate--2,6-diaminopimelate ligase [Clostridia bacterium]